MRLTLRTLLAYMDDILDPADQEELGRKIESSDFATELIHRSRDSVRRLRLGAPDVFAGESDDVLGDDARLDANTVAEYLDNTLPPEQVADFEQHCLAQGVEADMLLAETASCHHILTMVLGEPAEVDGDLRRRLYALGASAGAATSAGAEFRVEPAHPRPETSLEKTTPQPVAETATAEEDHVPDYLRAAAAERRTHRMLAALAALVLVGAGLAFAFWPSGEVVEVSQTEGQSIDEVDVVRDQQPTDSDVGAPDQLVAQDESLADLEALAPGAPGANQEGGQAPPPLATPSTSEADAAEQPSETAAAPPDVTAEGMDEPSTADSADSAEGTALEMPPSTEITSTPNGEEPLNDAEPFNDVPDASIVDQGVAAPTAGNAAESANEAARSAEPSDDLEPDDVEMTAPEAAAGDVSELPVADVDPRDLSVPPEPTPADVDQGSASETAAGAVASEAVTAEDSAADPRRAGAADPGAAADAEPSGPPVAGNYLGNEDVLLALDRDRGAWKRLSRGSQLYQGDRVLTLPTFRAHVVLDDMNAFLAGGTELVLGAPKTGRGGAEGGVIELVRGRAVLSAGLNGNRLTVLLGEDPYSVQLDKSSSLAIEAHLQYTPGVDLQSAAANVRANWILASGSADLLISGEATHVSAPVQWSTHDGVVSAADAVEELPDWIAAEPASDLERRARGQIAEALAPNQTVAITLLEFADKSSRGRRRENRTLAAASGAYVGQFDPFVRALNDMDLRAYWGDLIETVQKSIVADPSALEPLGEAFESFRGDAAAADLLELTLGYDLGEIGEAPDEQQAAVLRQLVRWMDSDQLDYRVLAYHNVSELTGTDGLGGYRPWHIASQRSRSLRHYGDVAELWMRVRAHDQARRR